MQVGARRTRDLHRILVDNPTFEVAVGTVDNILSDAQFRGVHVVRAPSTFKTLKTASVSLAPDSMTFPKDATTAQLATTVEYQSAVLEAFKGIDDRV